MALGAAEMLHLVRSIFQTESRSDKDKPDFFLSAVVIKEVFLFNHPDMIYFHV